MSFESLKKSYTTSLEPVKQPSKVENPVKTQKSAFVPMTPEKLQLFRRRFDQDTVALQNSQSIVSKPKEFTVEKLELVVTLLLTRAGLKPQEYGQAITEGIDILEKQESHRFTSKELFGLLKEF